MKKENELKLFAVADLVEPICGKDNDHACDVAEQPSHWVSIRLTEDVTGRIKAGIDALLRKAKYVERGDIKAYRAVMNGLDDILQANKDAA